MKNQMLIYILLLTTLCTGKLYCQGGFQSDVDTIPSARVPGMPLPKGIEINYLRLSGGDIKSRPVSGDFVQDQAMIDGVSFVQYKLKLPLVLRPGTSLLLGFDYSERRYFFKKPDEIESSVFREIERGTLKSREVTLYYSKALDRKHFLSARMDLALNGDLNNIDEQRFAGFIRYSAAAMYGWQPHKNLSHGVGLYLNYTLGRPSVYPVFLWNKKLNDRWGIESKLPANFKLRRDFNEKSRLYLGYNLNGGSYVINGRFEPLNSFESAELRRSDIAFQANYEQSIYDFLWFQTGIGYSYNLSFRVSEENSFNNDSLVMNEVEPRVLFNFSLFVVPSEGLKRALGF